MGNYHEMPGMVKFIATIMMLLGRFEIFGFIQLFFFEQVEMTPGRTSVSLKKYFCS